MLFSDVGFHVGGSSQIKYIVLQVHYANVDKFKCRFVSVIEKYKNIKIHAWWLVLGHTLVILV